MKDTTTLSLRFTSQNDIYLSSFEGLLDSLNIADYYNSVEELPPIIKDKLARLMCLEVTPLYEPKKYPQTITGVGSRIGENVYWIELPIGETHEK